MFGPVWKFSAQVFILASRAMHRFMHRRYIDFLLSKTFFHKIHNYQQIYPQYPQPVRKKF
ncbi:hypothetical protein AB434_0854 [Heyndrickxia coagulans]|nr:hypothetical protein AB434_0854 [Heyndrickxia coagulans]ATW81766.1 hypothetical protein CIW84_01405 [Heyndrickxia coagulans]AVD57548.1 hypothetical protein C3766_16505 [Heyndrickxia coagulans]AWP38496.1 hypothetical protein CYJ15_16750 [Heyndrickxia coagulans]KGB29708.1 hypothetical protein IE89_09125 [Heyndrickxia coagulans]